MTKFLTGSSTQYTYTVPNLFGWGVGTYRGGWVNNQPEGHGIWEQNTVGKGYKVKVRYEGDWKAGKFDGRGEVRDGNGDTYTGSFKAGNMDGRGIHTFAEGSGKGKYEGEFRRGWYHGEGTYTALNGRQFTGQWSRDKLNGTQSLDDLEREAKRLGPPPSPTNGSSSTSTSSPIEIEEQEKKKREEKEEEERKHLQEKRDTFFVELRRLEVSINEKQHTFSHYIQTQIQSRAGDPVFLLDQVKELIIEVDSFRLELENKESDLSVLKTTKWFSYYEEVNRKRENLVTACEDLKREMNQSIESLEERKKDLDKKAEEDKAFEQRRTSGYTHFFEEEMEFDDKKAEEYRNNLKEKAKLPTKARFVKQIQKGMITARILQEEYGFTLYDASDVIEKVLPSSPSPSPSPSPQPPPSPQPHDHEYRLHQNDILFPNCKFYLDRKPKPDTSLLVEGSQNIFPVYGNTAEARQLILKVHKDHTLRDTECQILKDLRHEYYIVSYIEKMDFVNEQLICRTLEENKLYHGLILERGKWDLSKKIQTPQWKSASIDEKIIYVKQILEVVKYINDRGLIWRDVKPTNFVYFGDDFNLNGKLKAIDFDISLPQGTLIEDCQSTSFYTPPEIAELFQSRSSSRMKMYINETYDSWSSGMLILEMFDNCHFLNTEITGNHPHKAKSRQDFDILQRLTEETFLRDLQKYIEVHHKNKALSYPILTSLLCEQEKRKSVKEVLSMSCLRINATSKTAKFINEIKKTIDEMKVVIIEEINTENLAQYTHLKSMINQIQSSIPEISKDRDSFEHFFSTKISSVISCIEEHSSKTEIINLRNSLFDELSSSQSSLEDITAQLEEGFQIINDSLEDIHLKLDSGTKTIIDFQLEMVSQLDLLKKDDIEIGEDNDDDIDIILEDLETCQNQIKTLQSKTKLRKKEVKLFIQKFIFTLKTHCEDILQLSNLQFNELQAKLEEKCQESQDNPEQLHSLLSTLYSLMKPVHEKIEIIKNISE